VIEIIAQTIYEAHLANGIAKDLDWHVLSHAARDHWISVAERVVESLEARAAENLVPSSWLRRPA